MTRVNVTVKDANTGYGIAGAKVIVQQTLSYYCVGSILQSWNFYTDSSGFVAMDLGWGAGYKIWVEKQYYETGYKCESIPLFDYSIHTITFNLTPSGQLSKVNVYVKDASTGVGIAAKVIVQQTLSYYCIGPVLQEWTFYTTSYGFVGFDVGWGAGYKIWVEKSGYETGYKCETIPLGDYSVHTLTFNLKPTAPICEEGDTVNLEMCPDGVTWKKRKRCVNNKWVEETQNCPICQEGDIGIIEMCADGKTWKRRRRCVNGQWKDETQNCPTKDCQSANDCQTKHGNPQQGFHWECQSGECKQVSDTPTDECSSADTCQNKYGSPQTGYRWDCQNGRCVQIPEGVAPAVDWQTLASVGLVVAGVAVILAVTRKKKR